METLKQAIAEAQANKVAIGHFNISDTASLKAIFQAAQGLSSGAHKVPVIIGVSEGEREFIGTHEAAAMVKALREEHDFPIFINADHTHSLEKIKEAVEAGFDAVLFDAGKLPLEENIKATKEVVEYVRSVNPEILIEGELGYIGTSSEVFDVLPEGAAITEQDITKAEEAKRFAEETGVDLLAPAVGNIHGMFANAPSPHLFIDRILEIKQTAGLPMVLHGGSGTPDEDFIKAIDAGVNIVHINTELRRAWKKGVQEGLQNHPKDVAPYKLLADAVTEVQNVVSARLKLFNKI